DRAHLRARHPGNLEHRKAPAARGLQFDLDLLVVELAGAQLAAEHLLGRRTRVFANERADHALLGRLLGARLDVLALALARLGDADFHQIAHDLLDVAT